MAKNIYRMKFVLIAALAIVLGFSEFAAAFRGYNAGARPSVASPSGATAGYRPGNMVTGYNSGPGYGYGPGSNWGASAGTGGYNSGPGAGYGPGSYGSTSSWGGSRGWGCW